MPNPFRIGDMFYLRVRVPADVLKKVRGTKLNILIADTLKTVVVSNAVKVSLQTRDAQEARRRFVTALASVEAHWDAVRNGPQRLTHKISLAIAGELRQLWISILDDEPGPPEIWRQIIEADRQAAGGVTHRLEVPTAKTKLEALDGRYGAVTDAFLRNKGILVDEESRGRLLEHVAAAMAEMAEVNLRKAGGDYSDTGQTNTECLHRVLVGFVI